MKVENTAVALPEHVTKLMDRFHLAEKEIFLVGGSLRDMLLGIEPHDFDLATSALPEETMELFSDMRVIATGLKHGTVTVIAGGEPIEITTFRIDGSYTDSRHPDSVSFTSDIREDLSRRDFTVNAIAYSIADGIVDPFGGKADLGRRLIRAVGDPRLRFTEDALRIMRAFRFSAQLGFSIDEDTLLGAQEKRDGLANIARERIATEFLKLILTTRPESALHAMIRTGVLDYVVGNYCPSDKTIDTLYQMPRTDTARLGYFLSEADPDAARNILHSLKYSNKQIIGALAVARGARATLSTPADARRFIAYQGVYASEAVRASVLWGNSPKEAICWVDESQAPSKLSDLEISGRDLLRLGFSGKDIGKTLEALLDAVINTPELNDRDTLLQMAQEKLK